MTTLCYGIFVTLIFTLRTLRIWPFCDKVSAPRAQCLLPRLVSKLQAADALDNVPMSQRIVPIDWYYIIRFSVHFTSARSKFFLLDQSRMLRSLFMKDEHPPTTLWIENLLCQPHEVGALSIPVSRQEHLWWKARALRSGENSLWLEHLNSTGTTVRAVRPSVLLLFQPIIINNYKCLSTEESIDTYQHE